MGRSSKCKEKQCPGAHHITEKDIVRASDHSSAGFVIDKPGKWVLCDDVKWDITSGNSFAITVAVDNVTLEGDNHTMVQENTSAAGNFAIHILARVKNTTVQNIKFSRFSGGVVLVERGAKCVTIDHVDVTESAYAGAVTLATPINVSPPFPFDVSTWSAAIFFNGSDDEPIEGATVTNANFCDIGLLGTAPVYFQGTIANGVLTLTQPAVYELQNGFVLSGAGVANNTHIVSRIDATHYTIAPATSTVVAPVPMAVSDPNALFVEDGSLSAVFCHLTNDIVVSDIVVNKMFGEFFLNVIYFALCDNVVGRKWVIQDLSSFGLIKGYYPFKVDNAVFEDISVNRYVTNVNGSETSAAFFRNGAEGCKTDGLTNAVIRRNQYNGAVVQTQVPLSAGVLLLDALGLIVASVGFEEPGISRAVLVEDCFSAGHRNDGGGSLAFSGGGFAAPAAGYAIVSLLATTSLIELRGCTTKDVVGTGSAAFGILVSVAIVGGTENTLLNGNSIQGITSDILAAGIGDAATRTNMYKNQIDDIEGPAFNPGAGQLGGVGIILLPDNAGVVSSGTIIHKNRISHCSYTSILNLASAQNQLVTANYASNAGPAGASPNYVGLNPNVPIVVWNYVTTPAPATPSILANLDLREL